MNLSNVGNIIAVSEYFLLSLLFFWISKIPGANRSTLYWGGATLCTFFARLILLILPDTFDQGNKEVLYACLISTEKLLLALGFLNFYSIDIEKKRHLDIFIIYIAELGLIFATKYIFGNNHIFAVQFSLFNSFCILCIAYMVYRYRQDYSPFWCNLLSLFLIVFSIHWATYPIARLHPLWFQYGLIFGNFANLLIYLSYAVLALVLFQTRLLQAERTALEHARESLEASKAKSQFLANMSHEIRTPMNGIIGVAHLIGRTELNEKQQRYLEMIQSSAKSLMGIINDILDLSKIESGHLELVNSDFRPRVLICDTVKSFSANAHSKDLEINLFIDPDSPEKVRGDSIRLTQILINLVGNAVKFTQQGNISVIVHWHESPLAQMELIVEDTGIGIAKDKIETIFAPFTQADSSTTRIFGGTGLGLSIVNQTVKLMGGVIDVESTAGKGTTFTVKLPFSIVESASLPDFVSNHAIKLLKNFIWVRNELNQQWIHSILDSWDMPSTIIKNAQHLETLIADAESKNVFLILDYELLLANSQLQRVLRSKMDLVFVIVLISAESIKNHLKFEFVNYYFVRPIKQSEMFNALIEYCQPLDNLRYRTKTDHNQLAIDASKSATRVLVVEDNPVNQQMISGILEDEGFDVSLAENGQIAFERISDKPYDIILMDVQMPVMDGYEATRKIREFEGRNGYHHPIIAITANAFEEDREHCLAAGMDDFISKPVDPDILIKVIHRYL